MTDEAQPHPTREELESRLEDFRAFPQWTRVELVKRYERLLVAHLEALNTIKTVGDKLDTFCPPEEATVLRNRIRELECKLRVKA